MEDIIGLAVLCFVLFSVVKGFKKASTNRPGQRTPPPVQVTPFEKITWQSLLTDEDEPESVAPALAFSGEGASGEGRSLKEAEGRSLKDAEGCVGGSMRHQAHEGASVRASERAPQAAAVLTASAGAAVTARQLRSAVILSEILGAPKSRRGRRAP